MHLFGDKSEKPEHRFSGEYIGGHKLYPKKRDLDVLVYSNRIFLTKLNLDIPFTSIKNIENSEAERLTKTRMFLVPFFIGFFWKKKYLYTVLDYNDGMDDQSLVFDFHRAIEKVQGTIYQKVISARRKNLQSDTSAEISHGEIEDDNVREINDTKLEKQDGGKRPPQNKDKETRNLGSPIKW